MIGDRPTGTKPGWPPGRGWRNSNEVKCVDASPKMLIEHALQSPMDTVHDPAAGPVMSMMTPLVRVTI